MEEEIAGAGLALVTIALLLFRRSEKIKFSKEESKAYYDGLFRSDFNQEDWTE